MVNSAGAHKKPAETDPGARSSRGLASLRPMQWQNHVDFMVAARNPAVVTADGLRNARQLV